MPEWMIWIFASAAALTSGFGGALTGARFVAAQYAQKLQKISELEDKVERQLEHRLQKLEAFRSDHDRGCPGTGLVHDLDNVIGWLKRIDGKLDQYSHETREQRAQIASQSKWLENLDHAHNDHVKDRGIHHG